MNGKSIFIVGKKCDEIPLILCANGIVSIIIGRTYIVWTREYVVMMRWAGDMIVYVLRTTFSVLIIIMYGNFV